MNKKLFVNSTIMMIWYGIILALFGTGLILTFISPPNSLSFTDYTSLLAQGFISVFALTQFIKNYFIFKTENNNYKKQKLDKEITKRAAELIKEKEVK
jgi:hypothetical protein